MEFIETLKPIIDILGVIISTLAIAFGTYYSYRLYELESPNIIAEFMLVNSDFVKNPKSNFSKKENLDSVLIFLTNKSKYKNTALFLTDKKNVIYFFTPNSSREKKAGLEISKNSQVNKLVKLNEIDLPKIQNAKSIYVVDSAKREFEVPQKNLETFKKQIDDYFKIKMKTNP